MQSTPSPKKYLLVDKNFRRYSAPGDFRLGLSKAYGSEESQSEDESRKSKISVIDLSVLFEDSDSENSLELDTSISRNESPTPEQNQVPTDDCYDCRTKIQDDPHFWTIFCSWPAWKTLLISQIMSLCVTAINLLMRKMDQTLSVNAQNLPQYLYLGIIWTSQLAFRESGRGITQVIRLSGLRYIFLAALHVQASNIALTSLRHETYIGDQMMDCVAAGLSFIIAYVCLEVEFQGTHVAGLILSLLGSLTMCTTKPVNITGEDQTYDAIWGDIVRFGCGIFICFNTLAEELIVKSIDTVEYLGMIGLFGCTLCSAQTIALDTNIALPNNLVFWLELLALSIVQFIFKSIAPRVLRDIGTTGMHLSLATSTFYCQALQYDLIDSVKHRLLLVISYISIIGGIYVFTLKRTSMTQHYFYPIREVHLSRQFFNNEG